MRRIDEKDRLKGGVDAKDVDKYLHRFQPDEVSKGIAVEKEHTDSTATAKEIASDHLGEDPHYYSKLKKIHKESIDVFEFNFHDILEIVWDDDTPLAAVASPEKPKAAPPEAPKPQPKTDKPERGGIEGLLHAVLKSPDTPAPEGQSLYARRKERSMAAKAAKAANFAKRKELFRADQTKQGVPSHEIDASIAAMEPPPSRGYAAAGPYSKTHRHKTRAAKITPGPNPFADSGKKKVDPRAYRKWVPSPELQTAMAAIGKPWKKREPQQFVFMPKK